MRRAWLAAIATVLMASTPLSAQTGAHNYQRAYSYALRCFVVNDHNEAAQRIAYNAALRMGRLQGFSDARITKDFNWTIANESVRLARSSDYRSQLLAECRRIGMAS